MTRTNNIPFSRRPVVYHFTRVLKDPYIAIGFDVIKKLHQNISNEELKKGACHQYLLNLEGTARVTNYQMLLFDRFGQNTYVIGPKVQELFRRTDLTKITSAVINPPNPAFYIAVPNCPWKIWGGDRTKWHNLTGIYVSFTEAGSSEKDTKPRPGISICLWGDKNENSWDAKDDALLWFGIDFDTWKESGLNLEQHFQTNDVMNMLFSEDGGKPSAIHQEQFEMLINVLRLIFNMCLYLETEDPDIQIETEQEEIELLRKQIASKKSNGKRKKLERKLASIPKTRRVYIGPLFEDYSNEKPRGDGGPSHEVGTTSPMIEHTVAPHWQRYWVGSGEQRRQRWTLKGMYRRGSEKAERTITTFLE